MVRTRIRGLMVLALVLPILIVSAASAQEPAEGSKFKVNAAEIEIGGRVQTQFNTTSVQDEPGAEWLMRRVRLEAKVKINDVVSGKIQPDFAGDKVSLKDAYLQLTFDPAFQIIAGKAYRPFSLLEQTSSTRILPIERGLDIRGVDGGDQYELIHGLKYSDRDIGLQVKGAPSGAPLGFAYAAGVFQGPLQGEVGSQTTQQLAARATVRPVAPLQLGVGWSSRDFAGDVPAGAANPELRRGNAFEVDAEYGAFSPGFHLLGELSFGDADPFSDRNFLGAQGWLAYRTSNASGPISNIEPILRASYGSVDGVAGESDAGGTLVTPGINLHFGGLNRLMLNYDFWLPNGDGDNQGSFKAMFQLAF